VAYLGEVLMLCVLNVGLVNIREKVLKLSQYAMLGSNVGRASVRPELLPPALPSGQALLTLTPSLALPKSQRVLRDRVSRAGPSVADNLDGFTQGKR